MSVEATVLPSCVQYNLAATDYPTAIAKLLDCAKAANAIMDVQHIYEKLYGDKSFFQELGNGIAFPRAVSSEIKSYTLIFSKLQRPVKLTVGQKSVVEYICILLAPAPKNLSYLKFMNHVIRFLNSSPYKDDIRSASSSYELYQVLNKLA